MCSKRFREEALMMSTLHHSNIVFMQGLCWDEKLIGLTMEFNDTGSLTDYIKLAKEGANGKKTEKELTWVTPLLNFAQDIARGVHYLHTVKWYDDATKETRTSIIHRDIKPDNVLLFDKGHICKLTDFGESRGLDLEETMTQVGTALYIAPEVARGDRYTLKVDIFSYGMVLFQLAIGTKGMLLAEYLMKVFASENGRKNRRTPLSFIAHKMIADNWRPKRPEKEEFGVPTSIWSAIDACWDADASHHPSIESVLDQLEAVAKMEILRNFSMDQIKMEKASAGLLTHATSRDKNRANTFMISAFLATASHGNAKKIKMVNQLLDEIIKKEHVENMKDIVEEEWGILREKQEMKEGSRD